MPVKRLGLAALLMLGCSGGPPSEPPPPADGGTGVVMDLTPGKRRLALDVGGVTREVVVHVPTGLSPSVSVPMVMMLHGTSGSGDKFYGISGWVEKADQEHFIAVFPSALTLCRFSDENRDGVVQPGELEVTTRWADGHVGTTLRLCTDAELSRAPASVQASVESRTVPDDVGFLRAAVARLEAELPVDPARVTVSGFSNGAQMSARLAVDASDLFGAVAVAGGSLEVSGPIPRKLPVIVSLGSLDESALNKTPGVTEFPLDASALAIPQVAAVLDAFVQAMGLGGVTPSWTLERVAGVDVGHFTWHRDGTPDLEFLVIDGATHQYPNGTNHPVVMTELLWPTFAAARR